MKKVFILCMIGVSFILSCCTRDDEAVKKDAINCVKDFIQAINAKDTEIAKSLVDLEGSKLDDFVQTYIKFNPNWSLQEIDFSDEVGFVRSGDNLSTVVITIRHQNCSSKFMLRFDGKNGRSGNPHIYKTIDFLYTDLVKYESEKGFELHKDSEIDDMTFFRHYDVPEKVAQYVQSFFDDFREGKSIDDYYPSANGLELEIEDTLISVGAIKMILWNNQCSYKVYCTNDIVLYVFSSKVGKDNLVIGSSLGLYPYYKKAEELEDSFDYQINDSRPETDAACQDAIDSLKKQIPRILEEEKVRKEKEARQAAERARIEAEEEAERARIEAEKEAERAKKEKHKKERRTYWERVGLVIDDCKMTSGISKEGEDTKGIRFSVINPSPKTIKYVVAYVTGINRVGDKCTYQEQCRGIGPITQFESGVFSFDDVFVDRNGIIDDLSVSFRVIYKDGTSKNVKLNEALRSNGFTEDWWK